MLPLILILIFAIVLPIAWLASEFQPRIWLRILLGFGTLASAAAIAFAIASYNSLVYEIEANSYFGFENKRLIEETIDALQNGKSAEVLEQLETFNAQYHPSYESRASYDELITKYSENLNNGPANAPD
ncbi:MAG: hypothetical protein WD851_14170 [Pirellulales bacterium]